MNLSFLDQAIVGQQDRVELHSGEPLIITQPKDVFIYIASAGSCLRLYVFAAGHFTGNSH
jgi:hypothetical protein